jgi:cardiolipin synthase
MNATEVKVVVTGVDWMGSGVGSIESAMRQLFYDAKQEILLTVYTITNGADMLFDWLELALSHGVEIKLVINRLDDHTTEVINRLSRLEKSYPHLTIYNFKSDDFIDLHAKLIIVDRQKAIVGSSNLSRRGLLTNFELALIVEGIIATEIASIVDRLIGVLA